MSSVRILIADDHEVVRRGVRALLSSRKEWEVCGEAVDGKDAVDKAKELNPDVVVLDISMPYLNGSNQQRRTCAAKEAVLTDRRDAIALGHPVDEDTQTWRELAGVGIEDVNG